MAETSAMQLQGIGCLKAARGRADGGSFVSANRKYRPNRSVRRTARDSGFPRPASGLAGLHLEPVRMDRALNQWAINRCDRLIFGPASDPGAFAARSANRSATIDCEIKNCILSITYITITSAEAIADVIADLSAAPPSWAGCIRARLRTWPISFG